LAATKNGTPAVAFLVASPWTASVMARMAVTPARDWVVNVNDPKWKSATARALGRVEPVLHEADHEHLADPLCFAHRGEGPVDA